MEAMTSPLPPQILVVGCDEDSARSMADMLRKRGFTKLTVLTDGRRAVLTALRRRHDLAIVETCLCGMDGYEVAERLINLPVHEVGLPVILVSADGTEVPHLQARLLGAAAVLTWPFESHDLIRKTEEALAHLVPA